MPSSTYAIDTRASFTTMILMSSAPKVRFNSTEQDTSVAGEKKWTVELATSTPPQNGFKGTSEVLQVTVTGPATDPASGIAPGTPVEVEGLRIGFQPPEHSPDSSRIRGGRPYFSCTQIRPVLNGHRPVKADAA